MLKWCPNCEEEVQTDRHGLCPYCGEQIQRPLEKDNSLPEEIVGDDYEESDVDTEWN